MINEKAINMSRLSENDSIQNEIYENLPCQAMFNESVRKIKTNEPIILNNCNQNSNKKPTPSKELLYATPLRKSDRHKNVNRNKFKINNCIQYDKSNLDYKLINKDNISLKSNIEKDEITVNNILNNGTEDNILEERRILNFLKDTTHQKKLEIGKDCPNINFSCLAREEHFANLVQQNFSCESENFSSLNENDNNKEINSHNENETEEISKENLELFMDRKESPDKEVNNLVNKLSDNIIKKTINVFINREWVLKKIALCLEQRIANKNLINLGSSQNENSTKILSSGNSNIIKSLQNVNNTLYHGCLILGSNGSGKTAICQSIINGNTGTKGLLNRKLLACYFIDSQNPDCHSISLFIRNIVLQILSHSSQLDKKNTNNLIDDNKITKNLNDFQEQISIDDNTDNMDINNLKSIEISELTQDNDIKNDTNELKTKSSPNKKSKIPIAIGNRTSIKNNTQQQQPQQGGGEDIADVIGDEMKYEIEAEINDELEKITINNCNENDEIKNKNLDIPIPLPKLKNCRTIIADEYYEKLLNNSELMEYLNIDYIEKNPDECFKNIILFPLLELQPPKTTLLLLIDSIDENYINEDNLLSTLRSKNTTNKSRNVAELLSNHIHLFPKWLFLVCTMKKQTKNITKLFNGFKKITLDDLRKSHVVKDVQEYIINRLNSDFKDTINVSKDIIESLHQLYIKSNGCILYLEKVLNGIKDNFFSFREIKLIPCTLNGLYLYICQKSFNKKQYLKIRPILNILLATNGFIDKLFLFNCLKTNNYTIDINEFDKRLELIKNIIIYNDNGNKIKLFHNSFADWLVDIKFSTKKFICDINEGHVMISMYLILISNTLCPNNVRKLIKHLIKTGEYLNNKSINIDLILILLEININLNDCFYTNLLNCCGLCEYEYKNNQNLLPKTNDMIQKFLNNDLNNEFTTYLCDFFKPNLPTDTKVLKLLIETGINNIEPQASNTSSLNSPICSDKSQNIDFELADLLITSQKACKHDVQRPKSSSDKSESIQQDCHDENTTVLKQISDLHRIEMHKGKALIHILASEGNYFLLERALNACKNNVDLEIEDYNGQTALNIAARNGHLDVVKILLNFNQTINDGTNRKITVDINHADRDGWTPLRSASWGGHIEVVKLLINHPGCLIDLADKEGRTALRAAAWSGHEDILKILIESGANVNSVDKQGRTSLIAASYMGHYDIVEILLEHGANVNHLDLDGRSALCVAALCGSSGYSKVISTLLEHGANTDQLDNDGMSPLLVSSFEGNSEICELLLENGADPDLADFMGRTPLWAACTTGHSTVVKLLLFWGCGIDCMDSEGRTVLSIAAAQGNVETVRQLLDRGLDETHRDNAGWTPLHYAAFEGFHEVSLQLLESGAKIDECDNEGKTALHLAAQEGRQKCIQCLLEIHSIFVDQKAHDGKTAFRLACLEGHIDCVETLLKYNCDVNCKDADGRTTLYMLALENKIDVVKYLSEITDINVNIPDSEGRTALHVAAWQGHVDMVKLLLARGNADVNAMDLEYRTPLHSCAWQGNHEVMGILLYYGAIPDHACKQGATALGISAQEGHEKCVSILLKFNANPFKSDHCGRTPIKLAAKSNRTNILKIFESYAKTDESNSDNRPHPSSLRSPDNPPERPQGFFNSQTQSNQINIFGPSNNNMPANSFNPSNSTHSSNFYENTMRSDNSSIQKRKSVISNQSTASSNDAPLSFTQQLQRHAKMNRRTNQFVQGTSVINNKYSKGQTKHSHLLPDLDEYQINSVLNSTTNEADMFDVECMSPLYATPPHSPSSELSSPGQCNHPFEGLPQKTTPTTDQHFARDTHMRIILGNNKDNNQQSSKTKRSGIATNPAMRLIRSRIDSAAQLIRRTNNILNITSNSNQGSSSIGVKSGTFQWRKESQM